MNNMNELDKIKQTIETNGETFVCNVQSPWFDKILSKEKTVESRIYDEFYSKIKKGDKIVFKHVNSEKTFLGSIAVRNVINIRKYKNFEELLKQDLMQVFPGFESIVQGLMVYKQFYSNRQNDIDQYGVVSFELE